MPWNPLGHTRLSCCSYASGGDSSLPVSAKWLTWAVFVSRSLHVISSSDSDAMKREYSEGVKRKVQNHVVDFLHGSCDGFVMVED